MTTRTVAFTNSKGDFSFQWGSGQPAGMIPDASEVGTFSGQRNLDPANTSGARGGDLSAYGVSNMLGCELTANAPGFRSDRFDLGNHRASDNPDIGVIVLHRLANVEGTSVSATSFNAPKDARKAWEKGVQLLHKSKSAESEKELRKAVDIYPKYAAAWVDLGRARLQQKSMEPARAAFLKAIEADGKLVEPYVALGEMALGEQNWTDAAKYLDRALQLDPVDYPKLWFAGAVADYNVRNYEGAEKKARAAAKINQPNRDVHASQLLGLILLNNRDYAGADDALREYMKLSPDAKDLREVKAQLSEIEGHLHADYP
jgi:tetratricopeptide (TPR) repeat protein